MTKTAKTATAAKALRKISPGMRRLRANPAAAEIREAVLTDQENGRAEALAKIEAADAIDIPNALGEASAAIGAASEASQAAAEAPRARRAPQRQATER